MLLPSMPALLVVIASAMAFSLLKASSKSFLLACCFGLSVGIAGAGMFSVEIACASIFLVGRDFACAVLVWGGGVWEGTGAAS